MVLHQEDDGIKNSYFLNERTEYDSSSYSGHKDHFFANTVIPWYSSVSKYLEIREVNRETVLL
jgi:hypothetical protein